MTDINEIMKPATEAGEIYESVEHEREVKDARIAELEAIIALIEPTIDHLALECEDEEALAFIRRLQDYRNKYE